MTVYSPDFVCKEVMLGEGYRFELDTLLQTMNEESFGQSVQTIFDILVVAPRTRITPFISFMSKELTKYKEKCDLFLKTIEKCIETLPKYASVFLKNVRSNASESRIVSYLYAKLLQSPVISKDLAQLSLGNFIRINLGKNPSYQFLLVTMTVYAAAKDFIDEISKPLAIWIKSIVPTFISYFQNKQSEFFLKQFNEFFFNNNKIDYEWDSIFQNDDADAITEEKIKDSPVFFLSIFSQDLFLTPPPLLTAAAAYKANKCIQKLLQFGCKPDEKYLFEYDMFYFAGAVSNIEALDMLGRNEQRIKNFVRGAIKYGRNEIVKELNFYGPFDDGENALHVAALYNNYELIEYIIANKICSINDTSDFGDLPQHVAARRGCTEAIIKMGFSNDFDISAKNLANNDILGLATVFAHLDTEVFLRDLVEFDPQFNPASPNYRQVMRLSKKKTDVQATVIDPLSFFNIEEEEEEEVSDDEFSLRDY